MNDSLYDVVLRQTIEIVARHVDGIDVVEGSDLVTDLGFDSAEVMDVVAEFEDAFDITVPLSVLPDLHTAGDMAQHLAALVRRGQAPLSEASA